MFFEMTSRLQNSLVFRLTFIYSTAFTLIGCVVFGIIYHQIQETALEKLDQELLEDVSSFEEAAADIGLDQAVEQLLRDISAEDPGEEFFRIITREGKVLKSSDTSLWISHSLDGGHLSAETVAVSYDYAIIRTDDGEADGRIISAPIGENGSMILQLGESLDEVEDYLDIFRRLLVILTGSLLVVTVCVGWIIARWSLSGLRNISETAKEIAGGNHASRVDTSAQLEEVRELAHSFNVMVDRITSLMGSMKDVNNSIAHDLRSPLARIRGIAEMTLIDDKSITDYREMAASTIEECDQLLLLINTMLDIAETEAGMAAAGSEHFDLVDLISCACELFRPLANEQDITLNSKVAGSLQFYGDRKRMQRIVTNLLENALKYTDAGGRVWISAEQQPGGVSVKVADTGVGISGSDQPFIYDRFFRCDKSRASSGFGLGLSLAKAYAESMNGTIAVRSELGKGSVFTLFFKGHPEVSGVV